MHIEFIDNIKITRAETRILQIHDNKYLTNPIHTVIVGSQAFIYSVRQREESPAKNPL